MTKTYRTLAQTGIHLALLVLIAFLLFPLIWVFSTSLKSTPEIYAGVADLWPQTLSFEHYLTITRESNLWSSMRNSVLTGVLATLLAVMIALPGAYALARYRSKLNQAVLGWILTSQIFPAILIMIPLYVLMRSLRLTDSLLGLSLVYVVWSLPFVLWMLHGYLKSIPVDLEEAAALDGATKSQTIFRVLLPALLPALGAAMLFTFISAWNEFFFALVLMKSPDAVTLPVELARYTGMEGQARTGPLAAASIIATLPSLLLFGAMQKWFASGLLSGAVKN